MTSDLPDMLDARDKLDSGIYLVRLLFMASGAMASEHRHAVSHAAAVALSHLQSAKATLDRLSEEGDAA